MQVETFIERNELQQLGSQENTDAYNQLCIDLGLDNLAIGPDTKVSGIPKLTEEEFSVYKYLMSKTTKLNEYSGVLPTRVLEAYKVCKENNWIGEREVQVWEAQELDDPILVVKYDYREFGLIARWGDHLMSFIELKKIAIERKKDELHESITRMQSMLRLHEKDPDSFAMSSILGNNSSIYL